MNQLILASSSIYRQQLLKQLGFEFTSIKPNVDESPDPQETPIDLVKRLANDKAKIIAIDHPSAFVIGSDQIAVFEDQIIGKPLSFKSAKEQLTKFSRNTIEFLTGVSLICIEEKVCEYQLSRVTVEFRRLTELEIERYLSLDEPFDCAGSFKIEAHGIRLFESVKSDDPTSLQGLPLIALNRMLRNSEF
ncbi:MAG: septum formation protein Maf [Gammaproteobacteria bacterium]|nr:MAG: septum formation protein Maf [Gammaproteobacteria bacterium]